MNPQSEILKATDWLKEINRDFPSNEQIMTELATRLLQARLMYAEEHTARMELLKAHAKVLDENEQLRFRLAMWENPIP